MKFSSFLLIIYLQISCAHIGKNSTEDPKLVSTYQKENVLNLVKNSYIRGCIDGKNDIYKISTHGRRLEKCQELAKKHTKDIKDLLGIKD